MTPYGSSQWKQKRKLYFSAISSSPQVGSVVGQDDQLSLSLAEGLQGLLVSEAELAGLHHQGQAGVDGFQCLFLKWEEGEAMG